MARTVMQLVLLTGIRAQMAKRDLETLGYTNVVNGMTWLQVQETMQQL